MTSTASAHAATASSSRTKVGLREPMSREAYLTLRHRYEPEHIRLVIIAESPPTSGRYFYDREGVPSEQLFAALMRHLRLDPIVKEAGLEAFQKRGWLLVDATYEPVNALSSSERDEIIARDYPLLRQDLATLTPDRSVPLILIKANVCRVLAPRLTADGFNVLNSGQVVFFPSHGRQNEFHRALGVILPAAEIQIT